MRRPAPGLRRVPTGRATGNAKRRPPVHPAVAPWLFLAVGLAAGVCSGLFGIGGGIVMTPVLHYGLGLPWSHAVALSLLAIALQSPVGVWLHARRGAVRWAMGAWLAAGGALGVALGAWLIARIGTPWLKLAFALLMAGAAARLAGRPPAPRAEVAHPAAHAGLGLGAGIVSRLLGIGGGLLTVPVLALWGTPMHQAVGTSLVAVFTSAALASGATLAAGAAGVEGLWMGLGALAGSALGVRLAHALPATGLRRAFAVVLVAAAAFVAATAFQPAP